MKRTFKVLNCVLLSVELAAFVQTVPDADAQPARSSDAESMIEFGSPAIIPGMPTPKSTPSPRPTPDGFPTPTPAPTGGSGGGSGIGAGILGGIIGGALAGLAGGGAGAGGSQGSCQGGGCQNGGCQNGKCFPKNNGKESISDKTQARKEDKKEDEDKPADAESPENVENEEPKENEVVNPATAEQVANAQPGDTIVYTAEGWGCPGCTALKNQTTVNGVPYGSMTTTGNVYVVPVYSDGSYIGGIYGGTVPKVVTVK